MEEDCRQLGSAAGSNQGPRACAVCVLRGCGSPNDVCGYAARRRARLGSDHPEHRVILQAAS